jgi:two-component system chemotaxis response regulator CheB
MRLLIVDDSVVFRSQIKSAVDSSLQVDYLATAANGKIALQKLEQEKFDAMTLDMEMPEMNGMETLKEIKARNIPVKVVVFAAHDKRGASSAMEALRLGAIDVVSKPDGSHTSFEDALEHVKSQLIPILREVEIGLASPTSQKVPDAVSPELDRSAKTMFPSIQSQQYPKVLVESFRPKAVVIGCSTGGPNALEVVFEYIRAPITIPILIVQHMPPVFTASLAERLASITGIESAEGRHGEVVRDGRIYVAPGDFHMGLAVAPGSVTIKISQGAKRCNVRPAVDVLFEDAASIYEHQLGGIILTGMGEDGMLGCRAIKQRGGGVVIQDKESSVVWGMPGAVHAAGAFDKVAPLHECGRILQGWVKR